MRYSVISLYSHRFLPWMMDRILSRQVIKSQRAFLLSEVREPVLEIGFGTGLNLPFYPDSVTALTVLDPNLGMHIRAQRRIAASSLRVKTAGMVDRRTFALENDRFESVVSMWTLCSVQDIHLVLAEIRRVLRPGGRLFFIEHGLSPDPRIAALQQRLNGVQKRVFDGCHLNRDMATLISQSRLAMERCDRFYLPRSWRVSGYTYRGTARKVE